MTNKEIKHVCIEKIENPNFLKDLSYKELDVLCFDIRKYLLDIVSKNGGHLSSNLGVVEATIALCRTFDFLNDKIIFDVGHQSYTYKLLTGRNLKDLRKKDGTSGFQKIKESPYDHYEAGHSSTSISVALGLATARDLNQQHYQVISFIGDSSFMNGLSLEAINDLAQMKHKVIVILNDNEMSISEAVGGLSKVFRKFSATDLYRKSKKAYKKIMFTTKLGIKLYDKTYKFKTFIKHRVLKMSLFDCLDFSVIGPVDGHNVKECEKAFNKAKLNEKSTIVILKTQKGHGYSPCENDKEGKWHGVNGFNIETGELNHSNQVSWSQYFANLLDEKMSKDNKVITITPGTGLGCGISSFKEKYPNRFIDVGIAEEHAITLSGGLSISGYKPVICIYSTFLQRAYDEISHDLARMNLNATLLIDRAGLVGSDGDTHQGLYDESFLIGIPNTTIAMPNNINVAKQLFEQSFDDHGVFAIRYPREYIPQNNREENVFFGKWIKEHEGNQTAIVSCGPIIEKLLEKIAENKLNIALYNAVYLKPIDADAIQELLKFDNIIIYDVYGTENGFANYLAANLLSSGYKNKICIKAIPDVFVCQATIEEQRDKYNLNIEEILKLV